jgi:hypothetical protein
MVVGRLMPTAGGVRHALDAAIDHCATTKPLYLAGYWGTTVVVSVALFVFGRRVNR